MRRRQSAEQGEASPLAVKLAWWAGFLATLILVFALAQAKDAHALTAAAPAAAQVAEEEADELPSEEEWEAELEEECEVLGEDEEEEFCEEAAEESAPADCILTGTKATVTAVPARSLVRLAVTYTARTAAAVRVELSLRGGRGPLRLGEDRARFGRTGTYRSSERLTERELGKVLAARSFSVDVGAINTPRGCHGLLDRRLSVRRAIGGAVTWSEPPARPRPGRG